MTSIKETRTFHVSVKNGQVMCDRTDEAVHVKPGNYEVFAVCLNGDSANAYELHSLGFDNNPRNAFSQQRLNPSTMLLLDDNQRGHERPEEVKMSIRVTPQGRGKDLFLDPIIVND